MGFWHEGSPRLDEPPYAVTSVRAIIEIAPVAGKSMRTPSPPPRWRCMGSAQARMNVYAWNTAISPDEALDGAVHSPIQQRSVQGQPGIAVISPPTSLCKPGALWSGPGEPGTAMCRFEWN